MERQQYNSPPVSEASDKLRNAAHHGNKHASPPKTKENFLHRKAVKQVRRRLPTILRSWLVITVLLAFIIALTCWRGRGKGAILGVLPRRLAGSDKDDFDFPHLPASPELDAICEGLGEWNPEEVQPGAPRRSPLLMQEFFATIEQTEEQQRSFVSASLPLTVRHEPYGPPGDRGSASKRPAPSYSDTRGEEASTLSWKMAKYSHPPQQPPALPAATGVPAAAAGIAGTYSSSTGGTEGPTTSAAAETPPRGPPEEFSYVRAPLSAGPAVPSTSGAAQGRITSRPQFFQLPTLKEGVQPRPWMPQNIFVVPLAARYFKILQEVRGLLRMRSLDRVELQALQVAIEDLANFVYYQMKDPLRDIPPHKAVKHMGMQFLVMHTLYSATQVLEKNRPLWWDQVVAVLPSPPTYSTFLSYLPGVRSRVALVKRLAEAVDKYRNYEYPGDEEVLELMRMLFLGPETTWDFRQSRWNPWRSDLA